MCRPFPKSCIYEPDKAVRKTAALLEILHGNTFVAVLCGFKITSPDTSLHCSPDWLFATRKKGE
jgi:hypothetical protein